jgi:hypothetical protein
VLLQVLCTGHEVGVITAASIKFDEDMFGRKKES